MKIPSHKKCFEIIEQMNMMSHIIDHSITVANVAYFLSKKLIFIIILTIIIILDGKIEKNNFS